MTPERVANAVAAQRTLVQRLLDEVARVGAAPPGITRDAFGTGENAAQAIIAEAARAIGLETRSDAACNLHMEWRGSDPAAQRVALGSHLDSVVQGGNFDGAAGVIGALAAVSALRSLGVRPRAGMLVLALRCEEAVWFGLGLVGSRAALGRLPKDALARRRLGTDRTLAEHMRDCGGDPEAVAARASASSARTRMSACRAASAATPRWPGRISRWRSMRCGRRKRRRGGPWPAPSGGSTRWRSDTR